MYDLDRVASQPYCDSKIIKLLQQLTPLLYLQNLRVQKLEAEKMAVKVL